MKTYKEYKSLVGKEIVAGESEENLTISIGEKLTVAKVIRHRNGSGKFGREYTVIYTDGRMKHYHETETI